MLTMALNRFNSRASLWRGVLESVPDNSAGPIAPVKNLMHLHEKVYAAKLEAVNDKSIEAESIKSRIGSWQKLREEAQKLPSAAGCRELLEAFALEEARFKAYFSGFSSFQHNLPWEITQTRKQLEARGIGSDVLREIKFIELAAYKRFAGSSSERRDEALKAASSIQRELVPLQIMTAR